MSFEKKELLIHQLCRFFDTHCIPYALEEAVNLCMITSDEAKELWEE